MDPDLLIAVALVLAIVISEALHPDHRKGV